MQPVPENRKISPSLVFFAISSVQIGVGALGFQRIIAKTAGYDAWISVIIAGLATNMIMWIMYKIVELGKEDLGENHRYVFGKWIGEYLIRFSFCILLLSLLSSFVLISKLFKFGCLLI